MTTKKLLLLLPLAAFACGDASDASDVSDTGAATLPTAAGTTATGTASTTDILTWDNFAKEFFDDYCVSCHSPDGQASADYSKYPVVKDRLNAIRCGVAPELLDGCEGEHPPGWFPIGPGPFPADDERWMLVEWIEEGAPRI